MAVDMAEAPIAIPEVVGNPENQKRVLGMIGCGRMGDGLLRKALLGPNTSVVAFDTDPRVLAKLEHELEDTGRLWTAKTVGELADRCAELSPEDPFAAWTQIAAGTPTEERLLELSEHPEVRDRGILVDGANSHPEDGDRRHDELAKIGIPFAGIGVSGGIIAAAEDAGYPLFVGGNRSAYSHLVPVLDSMGHPHGGHVYVGERGGDGNFVKMIHNGTEYGAMDSIAIGAAILHAANESGDRNIDPLTVYSGYENNSLMQGFLNRCMIRILQRGHELGDRPATVGSASLETQWFLDYAKRYGIDADTIQSSVDFRKRTVTDQDAQNSVRAWTLSEMRADFGGHKREAVKPAQ